LSVVSCSSSASFAVCAVRLSPASEDKFLPRAPQPDSPAVIHNKYTCSSIFFFIRNPPDYFLAFSFTLPDIDGTISADTRQKSPHPAYTAQRRDFPGNHIPHPKYPIPKTERRETDYKRNTETTD